MSKRLAIGLPLALVAGLGLAAGCHEHHARVTEVVVDRPVEEAPPPEVVYEPPPPSDEPIIVQQAPPPVIVETAPPPPAVGMIWINGYWTHQHGHYVWYKGRYVHPVPGRHLEAARWEHTRRGYEFHHERWVGGDDRRAHGGEHDGSRGGRNGDRH